MSAENELAADKKVLLSIKSLGPKVSKKEGQALALYSKDEVAKHNNDKDIWLIIHGKVYDVTSFLIDHPGGPEILIQHAGKDCTHDFEEIFHSVAARKMLDDYVIGVVEGYTGSPNAVHEKQSSTSSSVSGKSSDNAQLLALIPIVLIILAFIYFIFLK